METHIRQYSERNTVISPNIRTKHMNKYAHTWKCVCVCEHKHETITQKHTVMLIYNSWYTHKEMHPSLDGYLKCTSWRQIEVDHFN